MFLSKNDFINSYINDNNLNIIDFEEEKPWGGYYIYEVGDNYDKKILWVKPGQYLSLQYHGSKNHPGHEETVTALTDMKIVVGNLCIYENPESLPSELESLKVLTLKSKEKFVTQPGVLHAYANPFDDDAFLLETRTSPVNESYEDREKNITRVYDQSQRDGLPKWPEEIIRQLNN